MRATVSPRSHLVLTDPCPALGTAIAAALLPQCRARKRRWGKKAQRHAAAGFTGGVGFRTVHQIDIVERNLSRFQGKCPQRWLSSNSDRRSSSERTRSSLGLLSCLNNFRDLCEPGIIRRQPFSVLESINRNPYGATCERANGPVASILMPRHSFSHQCAGLPK